MNDKWRLARLLGVRGGIAHRPVVPVTADESGDLVAAPPKRCFEAEPVVVRCEVSPSLFHVNRCTCQPAPQTEPEEAGDD